MCTHGNSSNTVTMGTIHTIVRQTAYVYVRVGGRILRAEVQFTNLSYLHSCSRGKAGIGYVNVDWCVSDLD